jgi:DNA-binding transcriptional ArsR family regulator
VDGNRRIPSEIILAIHRHPHSRCKNSEDEDEDEDDVENCAPLTARPAAANLISSFVEMTFMRDFMYLTKALADETRVRILMALREGELCVCQITELLGLAPSTVSKHLALLHQAGLVESRKADRWVYYRLPGKEASRVVRSSLGWVARSVEKEARIVADWKQLKQILKTDPVELCKRHCPK